jgi:hypothetical protein
MNENFHKARIEVEKIDPLLFKQKLLQSKVSNFRRHCRLIGHIWKQGKGTAIAYILLAPIFWIVGRGQENMIPRYQQIFKESNESLKAELYGTKKATRRRFLKTWIELNEVGIEMTGLQLQSIQLIKDLEKNKVSFLQNPTAEKLSEFLASEETMFTFRERFAEILQKKAELQDKAIKYGRELSRFEKRDLEDFARAVLLDIAVSSYEKKALFFQTPIEIMLKSGKIMNRISSFLLLTPMLRAKAKFLKEEQREQINWLKTLVSLL